MRDYLFRVEQPTRRPITWGDVAVLIGVYAGLSIARMSAAYALSMLFTLVYGYLAAYHRRAEAGTDASARRAAERAHPFFPAGGAAQPQRHLAREDGR